MSSFLLVLLGLFIPTQLGYHFWPSTSFVYGLPIDYLSPTLFLTDLILIAVLLFNFRHLPKPTLPIIILIALNTFFSLNSPLTLIFWTRIYLLWSLLIFIRRQPPSVIRYFLMSLAASTIVICLLAVIQFTSQSSLGGLTYWLGERTFTISTPGIARASFFNLLLLRPYSTFSHPNSLSGYLLVVMLLLLSFKKSPNYLRYPALILSSITLVLAFSKAVFLSLLVLLLARLIPRRNFKFMFISFTLLATLIPTLIKLPIDFIRSQFIVDRVLLAKDAIEIFKHKPLLGTGLGTFTQSLGHYGLGIHGSRLLLQPVHNAPLLLLTELGVLWLTPLLFLHNSWKKVPESTLAYSLLLVVLTTSMFDHYWMTLTQNRLLLAATLGLLLNPQIKSILKS